MKKYLQKKLNNEKGMTLIELLAVIVIIAIIAAIAIPAISNIIENSRVGAIKSDALSVIQAAELAKTDTAITLGTAGQVTVGELKANGFLDDAGSFDAVDTAYVTLSTMGITGTGALANGLNIEFIDADRDEISAVPNGSDTGTSGVVVIDRP